MNLPLRVTPIVVTRGDVELHEVLMPLISARPFESGEGPYVWNNARAAIDMKLIGAFSCAAFVNTQLLYTQDDDCVVHNWYGLVEAWRPGKIVCNMAPDFQEAYRNKLDKLIGHGAVFEVDLIRPTFDLYFKYFPAQDELLLREANRLFTALNFERLTIADVGHRDLDWASSATRLWKQADHGAKHREALERATFILRKEGRI